MAAITPTVQKVTKGLRGIVKSIIENRKTKARSADETAADESVEANTSQEATPQTESTSRKAQSRPSSQPKVSAKSNKESNKKASGAAHKKATSHNKASAKKASVSAPNSQAKTETAAAPVNSVIPGVDQDPAHKPGHQKMNLKAQFSEKTGKKGKSQNAKAMNYMSGADKVHRTTSPHRRIINGAGTLGAKAPQGRSRKAH